MADPLVWMNAGGGEAQTKGGFSCLEPQFTRMVVIRAASEGALGVSCDRRSPSVS